ncbi:NADH-quinone oxidoreductase subunit L, partial [bacterium]|nr:NADH-quinone oxidoreductase subunit L [bacterium]
MLNILTVIPLSPLIAACFVGLFGKKLPKYFSYLVPIFGVTIAFILSGYALYLTLYGFKLNETVYTWLTSGGYTFEIGFLVDTLSAVMMVIVTFISLMVHIYTINYMKDDKGFSRFFSYISLFTFAMLMLVMSNNFLQLFFGWEAVGLVSYLLIGFWYKKPRAIHANLKAFLVNRVGDFGLILGVALIMFWFGTLDYEEVFNRLPALLSQYVILFNTSISLITLIGFCLFIGAMGKSAQVPLHVWLPDSMEGPTPISALIHAATMVTAGIFLVARMSPLFEQSDVLLSVVIVIGAITAISMGILGVIQNDIKKIIAYSTLSQLGYMTVALGVSAYSVAIFHLLTHAFFKALLFLGAGSVIIGMHHDQDITQMGGLKKYMPITAFTFLIGSLSLIGTPFFSGFYSKETIIEAVNLSTVWGANFAYYALLIGVFFTAFYSFRLYFLVFCGEEKWHKVKRKKNDH